MPAYPAMALLLGCAMAAEGKWIRRGTAMLTVTAACCAAATITILVLDRTVATPGDIFHALTSHPSAYTLSLGHMEDLTLASFAYLRRPLLLAALAFVIGAVGTFRAAPKRAFLCATLMMVLFYQAARVALIVFDPYLSSRPLAEAILRSPAGKLIVDKHYYAYSSVFFYTDKTALLLNGRILNLSYGSYAPGAPNVFIDDSQLKELWPTPDRYYLVAGHAALPRLEGVLGREKLNVVAESGGKYVFTNLPLPNSTLLPDNVCAQLTTVPHSMRPFGVEWGFSAVQPRLPASVRPATDAQPYPSEFVCYSAALTKPAMTRQTRYIHSRSEFFASNRADQSQSPQIAPMLRDLGWQSRNPVFAPVLSESGVEEPGPHIAPIWRDGTVRAALRVTVSRLPCRTSKRGSSVPGASLHCTSPEEDA